ncbi:GH32 C-terminal domain-containing protein [Corynebacterium alimapuense]|uniref:beta-fructofuranosidase n=1 Tax=Corynebacterium alimapuense TaxID=1576874 RepID=A0A3M8K5H6_9CORY|nr:GH32 C-terminal domain-containing protein [Corynebacterium alimapuense]RNE48461.1 beta-fructosidase [Corynebacterium alimapuense]
MSIRSYRPELHITAESGVLEAPAGVLLDGDTWHLFYQYRPTPDSPSRWAHVISEDGPFDWEVCEDAIAPTDQELELRAGSVVSAEDGLDLYFTSITSTGASIQVAHLADLSSPYLLSEDELAVDPRVSRVGEVVNDQAGHIRFRSPCVVPDWESPDNRDAGYDGWLMLAVTGPSGQPSPMVLSSDNGRDWDLVGPLTYEGDPGFEAASIVVGPRLIHLRDEVDEQIYDVLLVTLETSGLDVSGYLVGTLTGATFKVRTGFNRIDYGHDFTRPRNTNVTPDTINVEQHHRHATLFGLLNGIGRLDSPDQHLSFRTEGWSNILSLPRVATLQGGLLFQTPPAGLPEAITRTQGACSWTGLCEVDDGSRLTAEIIDGTGQIGAVITHSGTHLNLDRSMNPHHAGDLASSVKLVEADTDSLSIFVDGSAVEVFADGGAVTMASRVYLESGCREIRVTTTGNAEVIRSWERKPLSSAGLPDFGEPSPDE